MLLLQRILLVLLFLLAPGAAVLADDYEDAQAITPPRLSYLDGDVSFLRSGGEDWLAARPNIPLAIGDEIYAGEGANFELQIDARAFVRGDELTQIALVNQEHNYLQFRVTTGRVSLDLNRIDPGMIVEVATPDAVFTIAHEGYYRLDINGDTHFVTRRGGRATVIPAGGRAMDILASEEIVVRGGSPVRVESYVAPEPDRWDDWNYARSDDLLDAVSARYLPPGVYGANELDHYGNWRVVPEYGPIWIPDGVPSGWAPYSTGSWVWDPYYEWTWIDDAPWGWAPFHYGRWLAIDGIWCWAPGPVVRQRPVYSPALVAFFWAGDDIAVRIGTPGMYWVSLGWGEPVIPWWGRSGFRGRPSWGGWHGPHIVNNIVIHDRAVVNPGNIVYRNSRLARAVAYAPRDQFGHPHEHIGLADRVDIREMTRLQGTFPVRPGPESVAVGTRKGIRPPHAIETRPVVGTRAPRASNLPWRNDSPTVKAVPQTPVRVVPSTKRDDSGMRRPDYGQQGAEERPRPPPPPRYRETMPQTAPPAQPVEVRDGPSHRPSEPPVRVERQAPPSWQPPPAREAQQPVRVTPPPRETPQTGQTREIGRGRGEQNAPGEAVRSQERSRDEQRSLPGKPANQMFRRGNQDQDGRDDRRPGR
ncbi:MAG: hypothetical protein PHR30_12085 [Gallionellaceae bacterium]|nr:hypothetical protein [Gallionellaceae bacterium]